MACRVKLIYAFLWYTPPKHQFGTVLDGVKFSSALCAVLVTEDAKVSVILKL